MAKAFFDILKNTEKQPTVLEAMLESGLLSAYIPEFAHLESLVQHDVYHVYTVDSHLLQTVANLDRLSREEPVIFSEVVSPEILFLAGLLHDVGKGYRKERIFQATVCLCRKITLSTGTVYFQRQISRVLINR